MDSPVTLRKLAYILDLPVAWLKAEADAGRLPCLRVGGRYLFNTRAVEAALAERAGKEHKPVVAR